MSMELKKYKLSEIIEAFIPGDWGEESFSSESPNAVRCVRGADIVPIWNSDYDHIPVRYISNRSFANKQLKVGDIIIEKSGGSPTQSTGRTAFVSEELIRNATHLVCTNFCTAFRIKPGWNSKYVYYYLQHLYNNDVFFNFEGKTSGLKNLQIENAFDKATITQIPIEKQNQIVEVLDNLDRKIALNRAINRNLEALAKQIYDYWFVQFDFPDENGRPYKSSGGKMVWNEVLKREVPEGWEVKPLNTWLEIKSGFAFKSESYQSSGSYKIITIKNVQENRLDTSGCDYISQLPDGIKDWCILRVDDRLISLTGNCGRLCIVTEKDLLLNQRVGLLYCETNKKEFAYRLLCSTEFQTICSNLAKGAAQANLSPVELCKQYSMLPPEIVLSAFSSKLKPLIEHYTINEQQNAILTKQRDELLPLLMNGQVTIE